MYELSVLIVNSAYNSGTLLEKTPEMDELESNNKILKIWAHNFENQKS